MEPRRSRAHTGDVTERPNPLPSEVPSGDAPARTDEPASGSRWGRLVAALLVSVLVGALTFVLMAVGGAF